MPFKVLSIATTFTANTCSNTSILTREVNVKVLFSDAFWEISDLVDLSQGPCFPVLNIPGHTPELLALIQSNLGKLASDTRPIIHVHVGEHNLYNNRVY